MMVAAECSSSGRHNNINTIHCQQQPPTHPQQKHTHLVVLEDSLEVNPNIVARRGGLLENLLFNYTSGGQRSVDTG